VTWATSVPILVFLGLSVLDLGPMYATDRRQTASSLNAPPIRGRGIINGDMNSVLNAVSDIRKEETVKGVRPNEDKSGQEEGVNFCQFYAIILCEQSITAA